MTEVYVVMNYILLCLLVIMGLRMNVLMKIIETKYDSVYETIEAIQSGKQPKNDKEN